MNLAEQIAALEATRAAKAAELESIVEKSMDEGRSMDADEQSSFDELEADVKSLDEDLVRLRKLQKIVGQKAAPVEGDTPKKAAESRAGSTIVSLKQKEVPGIAFARFVRCVALARGNLVQAEKIAEKDYKDDQRIVNIVKAAVAAGSTTDTTWVGNLVGDESGVFADFAEFLRPQTIVGKFGQGGVPSLNNVPFRVPLLGQSSGGAGYWVGEGKAKPLTKFDFTRTTLEPLKVANIAVLTEEALRYSNPSAEMMVRNALAAALIERLDIDFINPAKTASSGVSPASITNGISAVNSSGNNADAVRADLKALFGAFIAANNAPTSGVFVMSSTMALALSLMMNPLGQPEFPGVTMMGGTLHGLPIIASEHVPAVSAGHRVALINAQDIYLGDEGGVMIDASREASLQMADDPNGSSIGTPQAAQLVSLWQTDSVGIRAERVINWKRRRDSGVALLQAVNWGDAA